MVHLPLSRRPGLMFEYTGKTNDPQWFNSIALTDDEVSESVKKILNEPLAVCTQIGLRPFYASNKPPGVNILTLYFSLSFSALTLL